MINHWELQRPGSISTMMNTVRLMESLFAKLIRSRGFQRRSLQVDPPGTTLSIWFRSKAKPHHTQPALALVHGFVANGLLTWVFQALCLAKHHLVICIPDLLFFGGSTTTSPERTTAFQGECLVKGLSLLGFQSCVVVGLSYGGMIGFEMAQTHPEMVAGMVVSGSVVTLKESLSNRALKRIRYSNWKEYLIAESVEGVKALLGIGTYKLPCLKDFFYNHFLEEMFSNRKERAELLEALVIRDEDFIPRHFQQRIHLIWEESDKIFTIEDANQLKEEVGGKTILKSIRKAGRLPPLERPCIYNKHLKELLRAMH